MYIREEGNIEKYTGGGKSGRKCEYVRNMRIYCAVV
jgi:hypothetical protein